MKTTTSIKLDADVKKEASELASEIGLSLSAVINASLKQFINDGYLNLKSQPKLKKSAEKELLQILDDVKKGKNLSGPYTSIEELEKALMK